MCPWLHLSPLQLRLRASLLLDPGVAAAPSPPASQDAGVPRSLLCLQDTHLPEWMKRFCPTYFISSGGPWCHRQRAAHASAALASRSSQTWPGGKEKGRQEFWLPRGGKRRNPLSCAQGAPIGVQKPHQAGKSPGAAIPQLGSSQMSQPWDQGS